MVVIAIISVLLAILVPSIGAARRYARLIKAHAELRGICTALETYACQNNDELPPTRASCATQTAYQLPVELATEDYLPIRRGAVPAAYVEDAFNPGQTYRYRAPGAMILNESAYLESGSRIWVPDDFPYCRSDEGQYMKEPDQCPVRYAIWSEGPDPGCEKLGKNAGRRPLPRCFWMMNIKDNGVITHFCDDNGRFKTSP